MNKIYDIVTNTEKPSSSNRGGRTSFGSFVRADIKKEKLVKEEKLRIEVEKNDKESLILDEKKASKSARISAVRDEEERIIKENNRVERSNLITAKLSNAFGTNTKIDSSPMRKKVIENILPKTFIPEQTSYPEPFEEEPALNKELSDFKKKINEHLHKMGFASSGGGGIGDISDAGDIDGGTALVNEKYLRYNSTTGKFVGADALPSSESIQDVVGAMFSSNTETNITATYQDSDGTLDLVIGTLNQDTTGLAGSATALATGRTVGMTGDVVWTSASFDGTGNVTGSATIQANSVDGTMVALGSDAAGDVMYYNGTNYIRLAKGSDDEVLTLASGVPSWAASGSGASLSGSTNNTVATVTGSNAIQGEGNLTFDGSTLAVTGATTVSGLTTLSGNLIIPNAGNIGSASDTDAISISSGGVVTFSQDIIIEDDITLDSDSAVLSFGEDNEIKLTHLHNQGLSITSTAAAPLVRRGEDTFIVLNGTDAAGTANAGDNLILDASAASTDVGDDIIGEDEVFVHTGMQRDVLNIKGSDGKILKSISGFSAGAI